MKLLIFGLGYTAGYVARSRLTHGDTVIGTVRSRDKAVALTQPGLTVRVFAPDRWDDDLAEDLASSEALLISVPPGNPQSSDAASPSGAADPVLAVWAKAIAAAPKLRWIGYLSTIGVYGDHAGGWIDEETPVDPGSARSRRRAEAEQAWLDLGAASGRPVHLFRLAGIYGPGSNQLVQLAQGKARRIVKPGQVFNRIHVADIVRVVEASLARPRAGAIYNVTDNEPSPPQDVVAYAAELCGRAPPPEIAFADAELTSMGRSFYAENKRVRNARLRDELGVTLAYPTYREGLAALRAAGEGPA